MSYSFEFQLWNLNQQRCVKGYAFHKISNELVFERVIFHSPTLKKAKYVKKRNHAYYVQIPQINWCMKG